MKCRVALGYEIQLKEVAFLLVYPPVTPDAMYLGISLGFDLPLAQVRFMHKITLGT